MQRHIGKRNKLTSITPETQMNLQHKQQGTCSPKMMRLATGLMGMCLAGYIAVPPIYWHLSETLTSVGHFSCPPCDCDCPDLPLFSNSQGLNFSFFTDCMKHDPEMSEETEKSYVDSLSDELKQREAVALENQYRADMALLEAKKVTSQYQKEAEKCNSGMETCEEAREKAEAALEVQKELSEMWEMRARQRGWKEATI
ncbi:uncharacterized protein [Coffea arabica]|uniref:Uncharacterized protein n=1 Tax=Coffea arabica TaxID=13443 RepID=A0A6P6UG72_COFAR